MNASTPRSVALERERHVVDEIASRSVLSDPILRLGLAQRFSLLDEREELIER